MDATTLLRLDRRLNELGMLGGPSAGELAEARKATLRLLRGDPSGLTLDVASLTMPVTGYMVGVLPWQHKQGSGMNIFGAPDYRQDPREFVESFVTGGIQSYWSIFREFGLLFGLWLYKETYYLDASIRFRGTLEDAQTLAELRGQIAIYDLSERKEWRKEQGSWERC